MRILTPIDFGLKMGRDGEVAELPPGTRLVFGDLTAHAVAGRCEQHGGTVRMSSARNYTRPYAGRAGAGETLLSWRACGIGDQIVWGGLLDIVADRHPGLRIVHYCHPGAAAAVWDGLEPESLPFEVRHTPIPWQDWAAADVHLVGEGLNESDSEPDQPDIWTGHLRAAGIDPAGVPQAARKPLVCWSQADSDAAAGVLGSVLHEPGQPYVVWQLAGSTPIRSYPPNETRRALELLAEWAGEDVAVMVASTPGITRRYGLDAMAIPHVAVCDTVPLRAWWPILAGADALVCPDSCFGHAAGALGTPTVSLWSSFLPADRVGSYRSHHPMVGRIECSPCRKHEKPWLPPGCPRHGGGYCRGLARIEPAEIVSKLKEII